jgi:hypothetical protein
LSYLDGGGSFPEVHLIEPLVLLFLVADVLPNRGLISPYRRYEIRAGQPSQIEKLLADMEAATTPRLPESTS